MSLIEMELGLSSFNVTLNEWKLFLPKIAESSLHCHSNMLRVQPSEIAELLNTSVSTIVSSNLEQLKNRLILPFTDDIIKRKNVFEDEAIKKLVSGGFDSQNWFSFPLYNLILSTTNLSVRALEILYGWNTNQLYALQTVVLSSYRSCGNVTSIEKTMYNISKIILEDLSCPVGLALSRSVKLVKTLHLPEENVRRLSVLEIFFKATSMDSWIEVANLLGAKLNSGLILDTPLLREIVRDNDGLSQEELENLSIPRIISTYIPIHDFFYTFNKFSPKFRQLLSTYGFTREELLQSSGLRIINTTTISELHDTVLKTLFLRYDVRNIVSLVGYSDYFSHDSNLTTLPSLEWPKIINALKQQSYKQVVQAFSLNIYDHPDALSIITREDGFRTIKTSIFGPFNVAYINNLSMCLFNKTLRSVEQNNIRVYEEFYIKNLTVTTTKKIRFENVTVQNFLSDTSQTLDEIEHTTLLKSVEMATGFQLEEIRCLYGESFVSTLNSSLTWENVMETRLCYTFTNLTFLQLITAVQNAPDVDCEIQACAICDRQATCDDSSSDSYRCTCLNGYEGNGLVCSDKDECENSTVCHEQATCTNTIASFICTCRAGFTGDGSRNCTDTNECSDPSACHPLATCINNIGSYNCTCQSGYIGDGRFQCTVIDSSSSSSPPSSLLPSSPLSSSPSPSSPSPKVNHPLTATRSL
ncbi:uncharacterized protein LOC124439807 isoform X2 [Xenia sp. Carnegie-2017]|nr:uncharacterized protein LOC124439807 isoform X2 [Xenia sp. Carnegie-2017]